MKIGKGEVEMRIFKAPCKFIPKDETIKFSSKNADNMTFNPMNGITFNIKKVEENLIEAEIEIKVGEENVQEQDLVDFGLNDEDQKIFKKEFLKLQTWYCFYNLDLSYDPKNLEMSVPKGTEITRQISVGVLFSIKRPEKIKSLEVEEFFKEAILSPVTERVLEINALKEMIKNLETTSGLLGEEKLVTPLIFFWICRIYFQQRGLNEVSERNYEVIFKSGMNYLEQRKIIKSYEIKPDSYDKNEDKQHIDIAFDLGLQENTDQFHDLAILRPIRNSAVHFYENKNSVESSKNEKDNLIKFIISQTDNYISIAKKMVKKCSEMIIYQHIREHKDFFHTKKNVDIIR